MKDFEALEPVLSHNNEPCWLTRKYEPSGNPETRSVNQILEENKPLQKKYSYELQPQGLFQCLKCGALIQTPKAGTLLEKPAECYGDQNGCGRKTSFIPVTKTIENISWKLPKWEDKESLDMKKIYHDTIELVKKLIMFSKEIEYKIYVLWIFSTWKLGCWDSVGFPAFIGIPNSGKTRALRVMYYLAYRGVKTTGITFPAIVRIAHYDHATLLVDEAHDRLNPRRAEGGEFLLFVKDSYKEDSHYVTCDNNDQEKTITYKNFGFKAFAGEKTFNPALITRSLVFWMDKDNPEIAKLSYVKDEFDRIRTYLLNYRYKTVDPPDLGNDFVLKGRTREIFESIIATGMHIGIEMDDIIEYAKERDRKEEERLKDTPQYEILSIIKNAQEHPFGDETEYIKIDTILNEMGALTDDKVENGKKRRWIGRTLSNMGIERNRRKIDGVSIRVVVFDENIERLKMHYRRYSLC